MENEDGQERRAKRQKTNHKSAVFERLKQLKGKGSKNKYEISDVDNVYEVVNEKEYSQSVMDRQDNWIVDDDGSGYVEDGRDIFDDDLDAESISQASKTTGERKKRKNVSKAAVKGNIQAMLANMPEKKQESGKLDDDEFLSDIISGLDEGASTSKPKAVVDMRTKFDKDREAREYMNSLADPKPVKITLKPGVVKKPKAVLQEITNESNIDDIEATEAAEDVSNCEEDAEKMELTKSVDVDVDADVVFDGDFTVEDIEGIEMLEDISVKAEGVEEVMLPAEWTEWEEEIPIMEAASIPQDIPLCENEDKEKVFSFFWWDAYEDIWNQPGVVYLFGKTYIESSKSYASCCVVVKNIERKLFLLPRPFKLDKSGQETDVPVKILDVYKEWSEIAKKSKIPKFRTMTVNKKYAFDPDVPAQSDYLEVRYLPSYPQMEKNLSGSTFSRVFGITTSYQEILLLDKKIKGPCWLELKGPTSATNPVSWCKFEVNCLDPRHLIIAKNTQKPPPPLVVATLNITTVPDKNLRNEIVMISCVVHHNYCVDKQPPNPPFQQRFCVITSPSVGSFPPDIHRTLQTYKLTRVQKMDSERALLNYFLNTFDKIDADLVVGHDLMDFHLNNLCMRLFDAKPMKWSRIGKLKRNIIPLPGKKSRDLMVGRLVCDLKQSAKELIKSRSYDLDTLCETVLKLNPSERCVVDASDVLKMFASAPTIIRLITLGMREAGYITRLLYELNVIPLALQITKIAGNTLSQTLQGGRAQRNEFLLLHAFTERSYICPDKNYARKPAATAAKKKAPTYAGGLVLDPKTGFYDKLILLMDFNSLYPSIIQEFNICFTTMSPELSVEEMLAGAKREPGILPAEIRKLVECRREVKKLMSNSNLSNDQRIQYNIRQLALKLTANSMYGCLGFQNSRFFAKHLASLITLKGRDILMHTRDLVQSMGFEVVYGDTDSIMINTNVLEYNEALQFGKKIKQTVNKFYKQVELDVDGVFKYMLLLKKKKYAALTMSRGIKGELILQQEHKGLDIVRRDWSVLASKAGKMILDEILTERTADERIEKVLEILHKLGDDLRDDKVPPQLCVITKQLTKDPRAYTDKIILSHVAVALRYNEKGGKPLGAGDTVPYVICADGSGASATQRAYHIDELMNNHLKIDVDYYLAQQIHPVISRLCEPLEGLDACQIANALGIDASVYTKAKPSVNEGAQVAVVPIKSYANAECFQFTCVACQQVNVVTKLVADKAVWLEKCSNFQCTVKPVEYLASIQNKLVLDVKNYIEKYYEKTLICEDPLCPNRTSVVPPKFIGKYPVCNMCTAGLMYSEYTARDLYEQLCFFHSLCDISKIQKKTIHPTIESAYRTLNRNVQLFLNKSQYAVIDVTSLFANVLGASEGANVDSEQYLYAEIDELDWS